MKDKIAAYLKLGAEGPYFYRMVETVLSRDKNWVRWKVDNCPPISKDAVSAKNYEGAITAAQKSATNKRLRPTPMGSLSLDFLGDGDSDNAMEKLKAQERYKLPELETFKRKIADDDFEIEMPTNTETKAAAVEGKASKTWRALRIAGKFRLAAFDKIENEDKIDIIFEDVIPEAEEVDQVSEEAISLPENRAPLAVVDVLHPRRSPLVKMLLDKHPGAFKKVPLHTTRNPEEGETGSHDYTFVDKQAFNMMRDGDQLLEFVETEELSQGTSGKAMEAISESGKVPVLELDHTVSTSDACPGLSRIFANSGTGSSASKRYGLLGTLHPHRITDPSGC